MNYQNDSRRDRKSILCCIYKRSLMLLKTFPQTAGPDDFLVNRIKHLNKRIPNLQNCLKNRKGKHFSTYFLKLALPQYQNQTDTSKKTKTIMSLMKNP